MSTRILILTNSPLCRNPRVVKEATTLGQASYDVTVLGIRNHRPSVEIDRELVAASPFKHLYINMLGDDAPAIERVAVSWRRLCHRAAREATHRFGWQLSGALGPARALLRAARAQPADLIIAHNEIPHWVAVRLLAEGHRVAADIEDWHSEDLLPQDRSFRPLDLLRTNEAALLKAAAYTTTTSHALADALHARYGGRKPAVVTNSFPLSETELTRPTGAVPSFFWFSQTTGLGRGLELFLAAWARTTLPSTVSLLGEVRPKYAHILLADLPPAFRERVRFLPLVPPSELPGIIAKHDIGLALEQSLIANRDLTITNKILQYLNAGLAVVASNTAGQREVMEHAPDAGLLVDLHETTALAARLDNLLSDAAALARCRQAARRLAESRYCWEHESAHLLDLVGTALGAKR